MDSQDQIKNLEKISSHEEMHQAFERGEEKKAEKLELSDEEREAIKEELRREIEMMDSDPALKKEAEDKAKQIGSLAIDKIMDHLLEIVREKGEKGIILAFNVAYKMNDAFILDTFRDLLAREGYFKKFIKNKS